MKNNFDLKKFLVENKLTPNSRLLTERNDIVPTQDLEVSAAFEEAGIDMSRPVLVLTMDGGHGGQETQGIISAQKALKMFQRLRADGSEREDHYEFDNELDFQYEGYEYKLAYFEQESTTTALMQKVENKLTQNSKTLNENSTPEQLEKLTVGGKTYELGDFDPNDDGRILSIEKYPNGYFITGGVYSDYGDGDEPKEGYGYAIDLDGNQMDEDDLEGL